MDRGLAAKLIVMNQTITLLINAVEDLNNPLHYYWEEVGRGATMLDECILIHLN
jgi:hypothetical protein